MDAAQRVHPGKRTQHIRSPDDGLSAALRALFEPATPIVAPRRILMIGIYYAPDLTGIAPYTTAVAEHYAAQGHYVRVVTGIPHYPEWRRKKVLTGECPNPSVGRYGHFIPRRPSTIGRLMYEATWLASALRGISSSGYDAVIGVMPSLSAGVLAWIGARRCRVPFGLIFQDLTGLAASQAGYRAGGKVAGPIGRVETFLARHASQTAVIADGFRAYLEGAGIASSRITRVRNWARLEGPSESVEDTRRSFGWKPSDFVCVHAGNMGRKQGLDNVVEAAMLVADEGVKIVLAGDGNDRDRLMSKARQLKPRNLSFVGLQPHGRYQAMLRAADVLLVNQRAQVGAMALPSKLASYFAAGRPVVAAVAPDSEAALEIGLARAGVIVRPDAPAALARALRRLQASPESLTIMGARAKTYADRHLGAGPALSQYDAFLDNLILAGGRPTSARELRAG